MVSIFFYFALFFYFVRTLSNSFLHKMQFFEWNVWCVHSTYITCVKWEEELALKLECQFLITSLFLLAKNNVQNYGFKTFLCISLLNFLCKTIFSILHNSSSWGERRWWRGRGLRAISSCFLVFLCLLKITAILSRNRCIILLFY